MTYPLVNSTGASWSESIPEAHVVGLDRSKDMGADSFIVHVRPVNSPYYEYSAVCRSVSITDLPTMLTVNTTIGEYHTLGEFGVLPRTPLFYLFPVLRYMDEGGGYTLDIRFRSLEGGGLVQPMYYFKALRSEDMQRYSPWHSLAAPYYLATVTATPIWSDRVLVEASFRDKHVWNDLWMSGCMAWNEYQAIGLTNSGIAAAPVSGVMAWREDTWLSAHMKREWFTVLAEKWRINSIPVICHALGGGVAYLDIANCPRWIREAITYATTNQLVSTQVSARPKHISDIGVEVVLEVRARA